MPTLLWLTTWAGFTQTLRRMGEIEALSSRKRAKCYQKKFFSKLPFPRAGKSMNYVEIREFLTEKPNWRTVANKVFNKVIFRL